MAADLTYMVRTHERNPKGSSEDLRQDHWSNVPAVDGYSERNEAREWSSDKPKGIFPFPSLFIASPKS